MTAGYRASLSLTVGSLSTRAIDFIPNGAVYVYLNLYFLTVIVQTRKQRDNITTTKSSDTESTIVDNLRLFCQNRKNTNKPASFAWAFLIFYTIKIYMHNRSLPCDVIAVFHKISCKHHVSAWIATIAIFRVEKREMNHDGSLILSIFSNNQWKSDDFPLKIRS